MNSVRRHLSFVALATLSVQALVIALGVVSVCWRAEHTHGGADAMDCPHHGTPPASKGHAQHADETRPAHHHHHSPKTDANEDDDRLTCGCSSTVIAVYAGPAGIVAAPTLLSTSTYAVALARATNASPDDVRFPPLASPPREPFVKLA